MTAEYKRTNYPNDLSDNQWGRVMKFLVLNLKHIVNTVGVELIILRSKRLYVKEGEYPE